MPHQFSPQSQHSSHKNDGSSWNGQRRTAVNPIQPEIEPPEVSQEPIVHQEDFSHIPVRSSTPRVIQPKLQVSQVGDRFEQEADRVANQVLTRLGAPLLPMSWQVTSSGGENVEDERSPQSTVSQTDVPIDLTASIQSASSGGTPLPESTRSPMEQAFGADFSRIKVHTDHHAHQLNHALQSQAFTTGQHIFFQRNAYHPSRAAGQALIAHELVHTLQQRSASLKNSTSSDSSSPITPGQQIHAQAPTTGFIAPKGGDGNKKQGDGNKKGGNSNKKGTKGSVPDPAPVPDYTAQATALFNEVTQAENAASDTTKTLDEINAQLATIGQKLTQAQQLANQARNTNHLQSVNIKVNQIVAARARVETKKQTKIAVNGLAVVKTRSEKAAKGLKNAEVSMKSTLDASEAVISTKTSEDAKKQSEETKKHAKNVNSLNDLSKGELEAADKEYKVVEDASDQARSDGATQAKQEAHKYLQATQDYWDAIAQAYQLAQAAIQRAEGIVHLKEASEQKAKALTEAQEQSQIKTQKFVTAQNEAQTLNQKLLDAQAESNRAKQELTRLQGLIGQAQSTKSKALFIRRQAALAPAHAAPLASQQVQQAEVAADLAETQAIPAREAIASATKTQEETTQQEDLAKTAKQKADETLEETRKEKEQAEGNLSLAAQASTQANQQLATEEQSAQQQTQAAKDEVAQTERVRTLAGGQPQLAGLLKYTADKAKLETLLTAMGYSLLSQCLEEQSIGLNKVEQLLAAFGATDLKTFVTITDVKPGYELIKGFSAQALKDLADHPQIGALKLKGLISQTDATTIQSYETELTRDKLGDLLSQFEPPSAVFNITNLTLEKVKDLVSQFTATELKPYLTDFSVSQIKDLVSRFTATALKNYVATLGYNRLKVLIKDKKLTAEVLQGCVSPS